LKKKSYLNIKNNTQDKNVRWKKIRAPTVIITNVFYGKTKSRFRQLRKKNEIFQIGNKNS
jgi:hypothetical protein